MHKIFNRFALALLGLGMFFTPVSAEAKTTFITIGTGGITGVYYPTGGAIAKIVLWVWEPYYPSALLIRKYAIHV